MANSENFVLTDNSMAFTLLDQGYDVWLGNNRGSIYSRGHKEINASSKNYFQYSFPELAEYDLPAMIDYVLEETFQSKLTYIGHSDGNTQMFTALSENFQGMRSKITQFVALGAATRISNTEFNLFQFVADDLDSLKWWLNFFNINVLFSSGWRIGASAFCVAKK